MESVTTCQASVGAEEAGRVRTVLSGVRLAGSGPGVCINVSVITRQPAAQLTGSANASRASQATGKVGQKLDTTSSSCSEKNF